MRHSFKDVLNDEFEVHRIFMVTIILKHCHLLLDSTSQLRPLVMEAPREHDVIGSNVC